MMDIFNYKTECELSAPNKLQILFGAEKVWPKCSQMYANALKQVVAAEPNRYYLHVTFASDDGQETKAHKNHYYDDATCVVNHRVENLSFYLGHNSDSWIKFKDKLHIEVGACLTEIGN